MERRRRGEEKTTSISTFTRLSRVSPPAPRRSVVYLFLHPHNLFPESHLVPVSLPSPLDICMTVAQSERGREYRLEFTSRSPRAPRSPLALVRPRPPILSRNSRKRA